MKSQGGEEMGRIANMVYEDLVARGRRMKTARQWRGWIERFEKVAGVKDKYDRGDVIKYLAYCRELGVGQNSINTMLRPVKLLAQIQEWERGFPKLAMPRVKVTDIKRPELSYEEIVKMIKVGKRVLDGRRLAFLALSTTYGLRREEIVNLSKDGLIDSDSLRIETLKGGPATTHRIPCEIKRFLAGFENTDTRYMSRIFNSICYRVGVRKKRGSGYGWHSIRRRLATELITRGLPSLTVVRYMRWSDAWMKGELGMLGIYVKKEQGTIDEEVFKVHPFIEYWNGKK